MEKVPTIQFKVRGKLYAVDFNEFTGSEARLFRQTVGATFLAAVSGTVDALEMVAGFMWLVDRKDKPKLTYDDVLDTLRLPDIEFLSEDEAGDVSPPVLEEPSAPVSPPSLTSTASGPGR